MQLIVRTYYNKLSTICNFLITIRIPYILLYIQIYVYIHVHVYDALEIKNKYM